MFHYDERIYENNSLTITRPPLWPVGVLLTYGMNSLATLRGTSVFVLMHSGIVTGYQLLCDAHTVLQPHRGTAVFFFFTHLSSFSTFSFYVVVTLTVYNLIIKCLNVGQNLFLLAKVGWHNFFVIIKS